MPKPSPADELALECVRAHVELRRAASVLHDDVGSLLAVAGLRLQLLCMDFPDASERAAEASEAIGQAMEHVRRLSRAVEPSPVRHTGLKNALLDLAEAFPVATVRYTAAAVLPPVDADAVYRAIANSVAAASRAPGVTRIRISVSGARALVARVEHDGRQRGAGKELAATALLARHAGLRFEIKTRQAKTRRGTIVVIQYAG